MERCEELALEIRSAELKDAPRIWQLVSESEVLDTNSAYLYMLLCRDFHETCLVACRGNSLLGFVTAYRLPADSKTLFVWQVGVAPDARRQGIAGKLLRELVDRTRKTSLVHLEATVSPSNLASRRLFESLAQSFGVGFAEVPNSGFRETDFPESGHEAEPVIRLGPFV